MPKDIRSFFGGGPHPSTNTSSSKQNINRSASTFKGRGRRNIVTDSEDELELKKVENQSPRKTLMKGKTTAIAKETTTADYFAASSKPVRSSVRGKNASFGRNNFGKNESQISKSNSAHVAPPAANTRSPSSESSSLSGNHRSMSDSNPDTRRRHSTKDFDEIEESKKAKQLAVSSNTRGHRDDEMDVSLPLPSRVKKSLGGQKRELTRDSDESEYTTSPKRSKTVTGNISKPNARKLKANANQESIEEGEQVQKILDQVPTIRAPTPPARDADNKFSASSIAVQSSSTPLFSRADIPDGAENCLSGLTFVFTGTLDSFSREEGQELVKRYGGKVTASASSKTDYVVLGADAGPKKLEIIAKHSLKVINENGLFALIKTMPANGGAGKAATKANQKREAEEKKMEEEARKEAREMGKGNNDVALAAEKSDGVYLDQPRLDDQLWTVKYAPSQIGHICGNKSQIERLQGWLRNWQRNAKADFKKGGPDGSGLYRAVMIHGSPGIGKTTAAHLVSRLEGYDVVESNASDTRSKRLVESGLKGVLETTSLLGYFAGDGQKVDPKKKKLLLIMDEVDGMSAGDRGGVGAMAAVCRKTNIPIILICNERKLQKMKPFDHVTFDIPFRKPTTDQVRSRIMTILYREGMNKTVPQNAVNALIEGAGADIRRVINMISTAKREGDSIDFDESKRMTKSWEKNVILKPWDIAQKILSGVMFAPSSRASLNDKIELYFNDHEFSYLMLQENYLSTYPTQGRNLHDKKKKDLKALQLVENAAESISDGDLVDAMIHGPQQHWTLMPAHAVLSFVRPASFVAGSTVGNQMRFTSWLGNNSKGGKLARLIKEIHSHTRLRASGDRHELRQQYLPVLWTYLVKGLEEHGGEPGAVESIIELMDSYYLTKDDWDAISEIGLGPHSLEKIKINSQIKSTFTRKYNASSHPLPFIKGGSGSAAPNKTRERPDLEEALDESDDNEVTADHAADEEDDEELDLKKDKYVRAPQKKGGRKDKGKSSKSKGIERQRKK